MFRTRWQKTRRWWKIIFALLAIGLGLSVFWLRQERPTNATSMLTSVEEAINTSVSHLSPSPMPFAEMTVPALRNRTYESSLGEQQRISESSTYTSYLTHYTSDGLRINALLTQPKGEMPEGGWPAIVFIHGYIPPTLYQTRGPQYSAYVDYLARNGFVVLKIDLRGHGDSEGEPGGAYYSSDYIVDALHAYNALQKTEYVNAEKIGLWGHSMAGNVVLRTVAVKQDIPAAVIWAGAVYSYEDWQKYGINDNSYRPPSTSTERQRRREQLFATHGQFSAQSEFWQQVAPTNFLDDVSGAIQVHHAVNDTVVPIGYTRDLKSVLDQTSLDHEIFEYQSGGHDIEGSSFSQAMNRTVDFFRRYL